MLSDRPDKRPVEGWGRASTRLDPVSSVLKGNPIPHPGSLYNNISHPIPAIETATGRSNNRWPRVRFQNTYFGAKFEWNQNFLRRGRQRQTERALSVRPKKERLAVRSCFIKEEGRT